MAVNLSELTEYVEENADVLVGKAINEGQTLSLLNKYGVRGIGRELNEIASTPIGRNSACGFQDDSESKISQETLNVNLHTFDHQICMDKLSKYFTDLARNTSAGSYNEEAPFGSQIFDEFIKKVNQINEINIWQADTQTGSGNLALTDGIITVLDGKPVVNANASGYQTVDNSNIIDVIDEIDDSIDEDVYGEDDVHMFVPISWYRMYIKALRDANLYHYDAKMGEFMYQIPSTSTVLVGTRGLKGVDKAYAFSLSNAAVGIADGGENDVENFKSEFDTKEDALWMKIKYKLGVSFFHPEEVSVFELATS